MDRWQTTVRGNTYKDIAEAARVEVIRFFQVEQDGLPPDFDLYITPHTVINDGQGHIASVTYEADVSVKI